MLFGKWSSLGLEMLRRENRLGIPDLEEDEALEGGLERCFEWLCEEFGR